MSNSLANRRRSKSVDNLNYVPPDQSRPKSTSLECGTLHDLVYKHLFLFHKTENASFLNETNLTRNRSGTATRGAVAINDEDEQFLLVCPSFTTASELFELLLSKWKEFDNEKSTNNRKSVLPFKNLLQRGTLHTHEEKKFRIVEVLSLWIRQHPIDFYSQDRTLDSSLVDSLKRFVAKEIKSYNSKSSSDLLKLIEEKLPKKFTYQDKTTQVNQGPEILWKAEVLLNLKEPTANSFLDFHPEEIARQMVLLEHKLFRAIDSREFLHGAWMKNNAKSIESLIDHFNKISKYVVWEIVRCKDSLEQRASVLTYWITIADKCRQIGHFDGVMEIMAGLGSSSILRLSQTWDMLSPKTTNVYQELERFTNTSLNFKELRSATESMSGPCLPYLGMFLSDLTFIDEGNPSKVENLINYSKWQQTARVLQKIRKFQMVEFAFKPLEILQQFLVKKIEVQEGEKELYQMSLECQARGAEVQRLTVRQSTIKNLKSVKEIVENKARRFQRGVGFTVNVTYIADRILLMGYPSRFKIAKYINFLEETHKDHYKIFNLSEDNSYAARPWKNKVSFYPIQRRSVPMLEHIESFITDINEYLDKHPMNVAALHCKGKIKDRSLLMVSSWLLKSKKCYSTAHAIQHCNAACNYAETPFNPSQIRYINYIENILIKNEIPSKTKTIILDKITLFTVPSFDKNGSCEPFFCIECQGRQIFRSRSKVENPKLASLDFACNQVIRGDVKIHFYHQSVETPMFSVCFHLGLIQDNKKLRLSKRDLDHAYLDTQHKNFHKDFRIEISFKKVKKAKAKDMKLNQILEKTEYKEALTEFMTNNGGIEKLELLNDTSEFEKIQNSNKTLLKQRGQQILSKHRSRINPATEKEISDNLVTNPTSQLFTKAKMEVFHDIEVEQLPKFLISDTYNNVEDLDNSSSSFSSFYQEEDNGQAKGTCAYCMKSIFDLNDSMTVGDFKYHMHCLYCENCKKQVDSKVCIIKNRKIYCTDCEGEKLFQTCHLCSKQITSNDFEELNIESVPFHWHRHCFKCHKCNEVTSKLDFVRGNLFCEEHFMDPDSNPPSLTTSATSLPGLDESPIVSPQSIEEPRPTSVILPPPNLPISAPPEDSMEPLQKPMKPVRKAPNPEDKKEEKKKEVILCDVCQKPIVDFFLRALGKTFHRECFVCCICNKPTIEFVFHKEKLYCGQHSHLAGKQHYCPGCGQQILRGNQMLVVEESRYHVDCFKCKQCQNKMTEYCVVDKQYLCTRCAEVQPSMKAETVSRSKGVDDKISELVVKSVKIVEEAITSVFKMKVKANHSVSTTDLVGVGRIASELKKELTNFTYVAPTEEPPFDELERLRFFVMHTLQHVYDSLSMLKMQITKTQEFDVLVVLVRQVQKIAKILSI